MSALTSADRALITRARQLAGLVGPAIREHTGERDAGMALAAALGEAQHLLRELTAIAERPGGDSDEDARRLGAIREVLRHFDWEFHDRQLALEAIERIADGGQP